MQAFKHKTVCLTKLPEMSEMSREQHGEYGYWYLGVKRSWLTFMASIAYSTWKRRPSGEKVLTPLKKIFTLTVFIASYPFAYMSWQMVKSHILKRQTNVWKVRDWDLSIFTAYLLIIMSPSFKVLKGTMNYRKVQC